MFRNYRNTTIDGAWTVPPTWSATVTCVSAAPGHDDTGHDGPMRTTCRTTDGLDLAVYDYGGTGPDLLLVHATGFCAEVLTPLIRHLTDRFRCVAVDLRGHGRSQRPPDGNFAWSGFAADVLAAVDHLGLARPMGFGHSCGGAALCLAEESRPGTFAGLYGFEPVIFPGDPVEPSMTNPLAVAAMRRRETFPSATDAFVNFSSKPPFSDLDPEALRWYVEAGFELIPGPDGGDGQSVRLRCRRDDEAQIYAHGASHDAFAHLDRITCHVALCCGAGTDAFGPSFLEQDAARLRSSTVNVIPGVGHFGPLQQPSVVAASVISALATLGDTPPS